MIVFLAAAIVTHELIPLLITPFGYLLHTIFFFITKRWCTLKHVFHHLFYSIVASVCAQRDQVKVAEGLIFQEWQFFSLSFVCQFSYLSIHQLIYLHACCLCDTYKNCQVFGHWQVDFALEHTDSCHLIIAIVSNITAKTAHYLIGLSRTIEHSFRLSVRVQWKCKVQRTDTFTCCLTGALFAIVGQSSWTWPKCILLICRLVMMDDRIIITNTTCICFECLC